MNAPLQLGRYSLFAQLASGGMATVYLGRLNSEAGFGRTVAIKRLHTHLATEREFVAMFRDEARLAARIQHPNVVPTLDVVTLGTELAIVMEYVRGESLVALLRETAARGVIPPIEVTAAIEIGILSGLHAAHEATDEAGQGLSIVHRDVSPQNVLVGLDGVARVLDFGIAKASTRLQTTSQGQLKGKLAYMAPEQVAGHVSRQTDIYAAGIVFWEALTCHRLFRGETEAQLFQQVSQAEVIAPSRFNREVSPELDRIVLKALAKDTNARYATAREMATDIDRALRPASAMTVAEWVESLAGEALEMRSRLVAELESSASRPRMQPGGAPRSVEPTEVRRPAREETGVATGAPTAAPSALRAASAEFAGDWLTGTRIAGILVGLVGLFIVTCGVLAWAVGRSSGPEDVSAAVPAVPADLPTTAPVVATSLPSTPAAASATPASPVPLASVPPARPDAAVTATPPPPPLPVTRPPPVAPLPRPVRPKADDSVDPFRGSRK